MDYTIISEKESDVSSIRFWSRIEKNNIERLSIIHLHRKERIFP